MSSEKIEVNEYISVKDRAKELDCNMPTQIAFIPRNFEDAKSRNDLLRESSEIELRKLLNQAGINLERFEKENEKYPIVIEKRFDWISPTLFISGVLISQNPELISVGLNVISNYIYDFFKGRVRDKTIKLDVVIEKTKSKKYARISYEGNSENIEKLYNVIEKIGKE